MVPIMTLALKVSAQCVNDHRYGLGITSLFLTQRARVRSPVVSISWLRFFRGFPSTVRQMSGNLGPIRPRLSYDHHTYHPSTDGDGL